MADWQIGDMAVEVPNKPGCITCTGEVDFGLPAGPMVVIAITRLPYVTMTCGLHFIGIEPALCSCGFVKVTPDADLIEQERREQVPA
jgi:hypothetical protein